MTIESYSEHHGPGKSKLRKTPRLEQDSPALCLAAPERYRHLSHPPITSAGSQLSPEKCQLILLEARTMPVASTRETAVSRLAS